MITKIKVALVALVASLATVTIAAPAHADLTDCPLGSFCFWTLTNYQGTRYTYNKGDIDTYYRRGVRLGKFASNRANSWFNNTTVSMNIYDDGACGYSPWTRTLAPKQYATAQGSDWGNRMSSFQVAAYAPNC